MSDEKNFFLVLDRENIVMAKRNLTDAEMVNRWNCFPDAQACAKVDERTYRQVSAGLTFTGDLPNEPQRQLV